MAINNPIIVVEDDKEDQELFQEAVTELDILNELIFFTYATDALEFLMTTPLQPFLIFTDINLPGISGIEFQKRICENEFLRKKSVPFVFLSTTDNPKIIDEVYERTVQGYFKKPDDFEKLKEIINSVFRYWNICKHPNSSLLSQSIL